MSTFRRAAGLIAALLLFATGAVMSVSGMAVVGMPLALVGLAASVWQGRRLYATRPRPQDPYDLSRLWEYGPPLEDEARDADGPLDGGDPFEEELLRDDNGTLYCHNCGHAVPDLFARCPECGQRLR